MSKISSIEAEICKNKEKPSFNCTNGDYSMGTDDSIQHCMYEKMQIYFKTNSKVF